MKKKVAETDMPIGKLTDIADFLPSPTELAEAEKRVKITILVNSSSVSFFKKEAKKNHTKYQRLMREVLDRYALRYEAA